YNVYVDSVLNKTVTIAAGGVYVIDGLYPETKYRISVRGVKDTMISKMSNTLTATTLEQETKILAGYSVLTSNNELGASVQAYPARAVYVATSGNKKVPPTIDGVQYYLVEVPEDAISCTVSCDGFMWGFNGWNTGSDGKLTYDVDSGWQASGATYTFEAGAAEYATISLKKTDGSDLTADDISNITVTFA
ncbi:MAG: fibronectin type III domain-containing protein, partial [Clostridia bacterium]|nr:fibronectin type III domain-containing protein [Clostridia bacterium]